MAAAAVATGGLAATWGAALKDSVFSARIKQSLTAQAMLMDPSMGYGNFTTLVQGLANKAESAANLMEKGDYFVVLNVPHENVNGDIVADHADAHANTTPGELFGTIRAAYMLEHHPADVFELIARTPVDGGAGVTSCTVLARLVKSFPALTPIPGYSPEATKDTEAKIGTVISFVWDDAVNVALIATDQLVSSVGGTPRIRKVVTDTAGKTAGVFNGEMRDGDGMALFCVDKANYVKEERKSRPLRRAAGSDRAIAFLGERGYVLDVPRIRRELEGAFCDPLREDSSLPTWAVGVNDFGRKIRSSPAWEDHQIFEALLLCDGTMSEASSISLRHCLPVGVKYDVNDQTALEVALDRLDCLLAHTFDPSFYKRSGPLCDRINGGDLCQRLPKHLWYAGERAFVQWQRIMRGDLLDQNAQFQMENRMPGQAARLWTECLDVNFSLDFLKKIQVDWDRIVDHQQADVAAIKSASTTPKETKDSSSMDDPKEPPKKKTKGSAAVSGTVMCTNFARSELKVAGAGGCKLDACQYHHYKLGSMRLEAAKEVISKHATPKQTASLLTAAEKSLRA